MRSKGKVGKESESMGQSKRSPHTRHRSQLYVINLQPWNRWLCGQLDDFEKPLKVLQMCSRFCSLIALKDLSSKTTGKLFCGLAQDFFDFEDETGTEKWTYEWYDICGDPCLCKSLKAAENFQWEISAVFVFMHDCAFTSAWDHNASAPTR